MIHEDYVSLEVAKLLKEKGFNNDYPKGDCTQYPCTVQMAMKWLREVHSIYISISIYVITQDFVKYSEVIYHRKNNNPLYHGIYLTKSELNYEQACQAALKYSLENLI